jgi:hypothetical protein
MAEENDQNEQQQPPAEAGVGVIEGLEREIREQTYSEEHPLGPFKAPESVEVAGIRENVGYVPTWLIILFIVAILLALVMWIRPGGPLS